MQKKKKIFILISDGVSLKNFGFSGFYDLGHKMGFEVFFWNISQIDISKYGYSQIWMHKVKSDFYSECMKSALIRIELNLYSQRFQDNIYKKYKFPLSFVDLKKSLKSILIKVLYILYNSENGAIKLRSKIRAHGRKTSYYDRCKFELFKESPDFVFSTSQRGLTSIVPLTAAQDLSIPTATFIYSWDNVPKATTLVTANYYFVWSNLMKEELLKYQPYIKSDQVKVTGTPQFENYYDTNLEQSKEAFFSNYDLDLSKKYICFSGDDITTSPQDHLYLKDLAIAVQELNSQGDNLGIIFRRCPVDLSSRYDNILETYNEVISPIEPKYTNFGERWNMVAPSKEDLLLQKSIVTYTECVVNLGSSMVFDYVTHNKPCAFMKYHYDKNYNQPIKGVDVYDFVHFRSMPSKDAVIWFSDPKTIGTQLKAALDNAGHFVAQARSWFEIINIHPPQSASKRIWNTIKDVL